MTRSDKAFALIFLAVLGIRFWPQLRSALPQKTDNPPVAALRPLEPQAEADQAVLAFMQNYASVMAAGTEKFAARIQSGEFRGNARQAAELYHAMSDDARTAAQAALKQRVNKLQDDPQAIADYTARSAAGWNEIVRRLAP